jgi:protein-S-isoprenylcysteine O-methyltransferase Ste14
MSGQNKLIKIFGIGIKGAIISFFLLVIAMLADSIFELPILVDYAVLMKTIGIILVILGLGLHFWSFFTLRSWWVDDKLCTRGPFKHFRHPMYAAWIKFICPGLALSFNSWFYIFWILLLHLLWHKLVRKEEIVMIDTFGKIYKDYARRTCRFFPKMLN